MQNRERTGSANNLEGWRKEVVANKFTRKTTILTEDIETTRSAEISM